MKKNLFYCSVLLGFSLSGASARAAEIGVDTAADENGTGAGCSLREAIQSANTDTAFGGCFAGSGIDEITFKGNIFNPGTITLSSPLTITDGVEIIGPGTLALTIHAAGANNPISIDGAKVFLSRLTFAGGLSTTGPGSIRITGSGNLTLEDVVFRENRGFNGGAILNEGTLTVRDSTFRRNQSDNNGGAIYSSGTLSLSNSTFTDNADIGFGGGALYVAAPAPRTTTIANSTFSDQSSNRGRAIQVEAGSVSVASSTLVDSELLIFVASGASMTFKNTVISTLGIGCENGGSIVSQGNNLDSGNSCSFNQAGDLTNANSQLGALQNNGGLTQTYLPAAGSPLIDGGDCTTGTATDQRGNPRPRNADCDIGAVELSDCGNGVLSTGEICDDGNITDGDGCNSVCQIEAGPIPPFGSCGNGTLEFPELCDDGNPLAGDGCGANCQVEPNFSCNLAQPSVCTLTDNGNGAGGGGGCSLNPDASLEFALAPFGAALFALAAFYRNRLTPTRRQ